MVSFRVLHAILSRPRHRTPHMSRTVSPKSRQPINMVAGRWQPNSNQHLVQWARGRLAQVQESREGHWVHVRGHSGEGGNDRADELVQWGKEEGPYARLRALGAGEGDGKDE